MKYLYDLNWNCYCYGCVEVNIGRIGRIGIGSGTDGTGSRARGVPYKCVRYSKRGIR